MRENSALVQQVRAEKHTRLRMKADLANCLPELGKTKYLGEMISDHKVFQILATQRTLTPDLFSDMFRNKEHSVFDSIETTPDCWDLVDKYPGEIREYVVYGGFVDLPDDGGELTIRAYALRDKVILVVRDVNTLDL